jgi:RNA polymerase sigma-70 factor (sigma-E family)
MSDRDEEFTAFAESRWDRLCRFAYALARDQQHAEDLVQRALAQVFVAWPRIRARESAESYARTCVTRCFLSETKRRRWREVPLTHAVEPSDTGASAEADVDARDEVWREICALPPRQRAVVVLRYYEDLSEAEIADVMDCSPGTVKSQCSKALGKLRLQLAVVSPTSQE